MNFQLLIVVLALWLIIDLCLAITTIEPVIIIHGGSGDISDDKIQPKFDGMKAALRVAYPILTETDNPIDAVEKAVNILENSFAFDAGHGSVQTITGEIEMDALIINGTDLSAGAVGCVRNVANPISLARLVMEKTEHVFLAGDAVREFAISTGIPLVPTRCLINSNFTNDEVTHKNKGVSKHGTVGAVAINSRGQIAAATSTGGMTDKMDGRIGSAPIIGVGTLADDSVAGVSVTGWGEALMRTRIASRVANLIEQGLTPTEAAAQALAFMANKIPEADGGIIVISSDGEVGYSWNSRRMAWAYTRKEADKIDQLIHFGIDHGIDFVDTLRTNETYPTGPPKCNFIHM